ILRASASSACAWLMKTIAMNSLWTCARRPMQPGARVRVSSRSTNAGREPHAGRVRRTRRPTGYAARMLQFLTPVAAARHPLPHWRVLMFATYIRRLTCVAAVAVVPCTALAQDDNGDAKATPTVRRTADQQSNVPVGVQEVERSVERAVDRFRIGVSGGVAFDPELIDVGAHATFGPIFNPNVEFRPGVELGLGEVTTTFGINLDVLYSLRDQ